MSEKRTYRIVIADDHGLVRGALKDLIADIDGAEIVAETDNGLEAITLARLHRPDLLTLDSAMPLAKGIEVYGEVRRWSPDTRIVVITGFAAVGHLADWIDAGVDGLFLKTCGTDELRKGLELVLSGGAFVSSAVMEKLEFHETDASLTTRERQILHLIAAGYSNNEIAERLSISPKTVDNHRTRMMAKLNVHSLAQLLSYALKEGLLDTNIQI
ncbi:MAG: response regulator transcription factor [Pseudomonadota bacterium]